MVCPPMFTLAIPVEAVLMTLLLLEFSTLASLSNKCVLPVLGCPKTHTLCPLRIASVASVPVSVMITSSISAVLINQCSVCVEI